MTTIEEGRVLAHIFECAARDIDIDYAKMDPENPEQCKEDYARIYNKLVSNIACIKSKAQSVTWKPEMVRKLKCFSIKPEPIDDWRKGDIRGDCHGCMTCNRWEHSNFKAVSLFGYCELIDDEREPFSSLEHITDDYTEYYNSYNQVFIDSKDRSKYRKFVDGFHDQDGGMLVLGETCHNRALLYCMANNFIFNFIFIADGHLQYIRQTKKKLHDDKLYASLEKDAEIIHEAFIKLQQMSAHETADISNDQLSVDHEWWKSVKTMRNGNPNLMNPSKGISDRITTFYGLLGRRGLQPWSTVTPVESAKPAKPPVTLADALGEHVAQHEATDRRASGKAVEVQQASSSASGSKRKHVEVGGSTSDSGSQASVDANAEKHQKLHKDLMRIKDKMVAAGHHKDAVVILEAALELARG
jgi:hypothetical protein